MSNTEPRCSGGVCPHQLTWVRATCWVPLVIKLQHVKFQPASCVQAAAQRHAWCHCFKKFASPLSVAPNLHATKSMQVEQALAVKKFSKGRSSSRCQGSASSCSPAVCTQCMGCSSGGELHTRPGCWLVSKRQSSAPAAGPAAGVQSTPPALRRCAEQASQIICYV